LATAGWAVVTRSGIVQARCGDRLKWPNGKLNPLQG
jgi:hypothetical protein